MRHRADGLQTRVGEGLLSLLHFGPLNNIIEDGSELRWSISDSWAKSEGGVGGLPED